MKILISAFEPFGKNIGGTNSSWESVLGIADVIDTAEIIKIQLPVKYTESIECLINAITVHNPDIVICVGQAEGRTAITPEFYAQNSIRSSAADNGGTVRFGTKVKNDGRVAYISLLPVKAMVRSMLENGINASLSYDAGGYVCNALMYNLLSYSEEHKPMPCGFVHVPKYIGQDENSSKANAMELELITKGLTLCIKEAIKSTQAKENTV